MSRQRQFRSRREEMAYLRSATASWRKGEAPPTPQEPRLDPSGLPLRQRAQALHNRLQSIFEGHVQDVIEQDPALSRQEAEARVVGWYQDAPDEVVQAVAEAEPDLPGEVQEVRAAAERRTLDLPRQLERATGDLVQRFVEKPLAVDERARIEAALQAATLDDDPAHATSRVLRALKSVDKERFDVLAGEDLDARMQMAEKMAPDPPRDFMEQPETDRERRQAELNELPLDELLPLSAELAEEAKVKAAADPAVETGPRTPYEADDLEALKAETAALDAELAQARGGA